MSQRILVWDLPVRFFHWSLVLAFFIAYFSEDDLLTAHVWAGYTAGGLVLFRIIWGFIGNRYARFADFLCSPIAAWHYLKDVIAFRARRYLGHNPAGAWMIVMLLFFLLLTTLSGLVVYAADQGAGPLAGMVSQKYEDWWEEAHEFCANFTLLLVVLHVLGVLLESIVHRENLARSMWHGYKNSDVEND